MPELALFVSDVHLSADRPEMVDAFLGFIEGEARTARTLFILGDLFDEWLGDDDNREPHPRISNALAALTSTGVEVAVARGNHDFLLGEGFAAGTGCRLLDEPEVILLGNDRALLLHGDSLCTRDLDYQELRRTVRDRATQRAFLALPLAERAARAATLRNSSRALTRLKAMDIIDVTPAAVDALLREHRAGILVHGHTHRPALHAVELDGIHATRMVLGDWYEQDSVGWWDGRALRLGRIADLRAACRDPG